MTLASVGIYGRTIGQPRALILTDQKLRRVAEGSAGLEVMPRRRRRGLSAARARTPGHLPDQALAVEFSRMNQARPQSHLALGGRGRQGLFLEFRGKKPRRD